MNILLMAPIWGYEGGIEQYMVNCLVEFSRMGHACSLVYGRISAKPVQDSIAQFLHAAYQISSLLQYESAEDTLDVERLNTILAKEKPDVIFMSEVKNIALLSRLKDYGGLVPMSHANMLVCMRTSNTTYVRRAICTHNVGYRCFLHGCFLRTQSSGVRKLARNSLQTHNLLLSMYKSIGIHIVPSNYSRQRLIQHGFRPDQVTVVKLFTDIQPLPAISLNGEQPIISFMGQIHRYKGLDYLLRALAHVSTPFRCSVIGDGAYLPYCKRLARTLGLSDVVDFKGWLSRNEIAVHLRNVYMTIVPSIWPEVFGLVGLEAMMCSKPVIAFDAGGISDWLEDGTNGYLVPVKNIGLLAAKIDALLKDPATAKRMGAEGRRLATSSFSRKQHFEHLLSVFGRAAAERRQRSVDNYLCRSMGGHATVSEVSN